jgi:GT2 family glycosyltransferase
LTEPTKISVVVVNWNGMEYLPSCLDSVFGQNYENIQVIVVDCASRDESVSFVRDNHPLTEIIQLKQDLGPPYAINLAARRAQGDLVLILNNDVILPQNMLSGLANRMRDDENCAVNPVEIHWKGEYVGSGCGCTWIGRFLYKLVRLRGYVPFYPSTACCLVARKVILENPLNENLFMYEDTEWGWRLHLKKVGLKVVDSTYFLHRSSGSEDTPYSPKQAYFMGRAVLATCFICFKLPTLIAVAPILMVNFLSQISRYARRGKFASIMAYMRGHLDVVWKMKRFDADRRRVQKERKIGDLRILKLMIGSVDFARRSRKRWEESGRTVPKVIPESSLRQVCE